MSNRNHNLKYKLKIFNIKQLKMKNKKLKLFKKKKKL